MQAARGGRVQARWPHRVGVVPGQAESFQRRGVAAVLDEAADGSAAPCQVLTGTGGVGKTQLAAAYARAAWQAGKVDLLAWVIAGSRDAVVAAYAPPAWRWPALIRTIWSRPRHGS